MIVSIVIFSQYFFQWILPGGKNFQLIAWLRQYLPFLNIFSQEILQGGKSVGLPHIAYTVIIKLRPQACNFVKKETAQVLSCEFCETFKKTFFTEHLWATACLTLSGALWKIRIESVVFMFYIIPKGAQ